MRRLWVLALVLIVGFAGPSAAQPTDEILRPSFWETQGLDVLAAWTAHARDTTHGAFHSHLDRRWQPVNGTDKYPGMIARHVFSYSAAYLMTGESEHLQRADRLVDYLIAHGWDERHGGWYNALRRDGAVADSTKDLFMQIYAATGLTLYYTATHDDRALRYVERTNQLLETHAWDAEHGGYVRALNRDLTVRAAHKDFTPQGAALSGYLLYLYHATRDDAYLEQSTRILDLMRGPMRAPGPPWIYERFAADWTFHLEVRKNASINIGHNIELAWLLLRLHKITGRAEYRTEAVALAEALRQRAFVDSGAWVTHLNRPDLRTHPDAASWWMQAYGNMMLLALHDATGDAAVIADFRRSASFWNRAFVDSTYGGTVLKTTLDGAVTKGAKAVRSKTSYHALEHALLNHLYLSLGRADQPVTLHFRIDPSAPDEVLYSLPIAAETTIQRVMIDGERWTEYDADDLAVRLPERGRPLHVTVTMH